MPRSAYGARHQYDRDVLLAARPYCEDGCGRRSSVADHSPPLSLHVGPHLAGSGCCKYRAQCIDCSRRQGGRIAQMLRVSRKVDEFVEPEPSPGPADPLWDAVGWIADLREVPVEATWPRFMTHPHPESVGSLAAEFEVFVFKRTGRHLFWFQRLIAARLLEVDADGRLVWMSWFVTMARQLGKSFLVGNLLLFVLTRSDALWPQVDADLLYSSRTLLSAESLVRGLLTWARDEGGDWSALRANGQKAVNWRNHSLLIRAVDSVYGETCGVAVVDEAWDVEQSSVDDSIGPATWAAQGQVGYTSTAHRKATPMCLRLRQSGLATLQAPGDLFVVEWSAAPWRERDDEEGWREASPNFDEHRYRRLASMLERAEAGVSVDPTELDPLAAFDTQGLNRWPTKAAVRSRVELLVPFDVWRRCAGRSVVPAGTGWCAVEDNREGAAGVGFAMLGVDGVFEVAGVACESWEKGMDWARDFVGERPGSRIAIGALLPDSVPSDFPGRSSMRIAGGRETRLGMSLLRSLVNDGRIVHEHSPDLDAQVTVARVRADVAGLTLLPGTPSAVLRAVLWALWFAQKASAAPRIA